MSIYRRASNRWAVLIDLERKPDGARNRVSLGTFSTRKEAERAEREALSARDRGLGLDPETLTVRELIDRFLLDAGRLDPKSFERYRGILKNNVEPQIGSFELRKLRADHITKLYAHLRTAGRVDGRGGLSPRSIHHVHRLLHNMLSWAERHQLVGRNIIRSVDAPRLGISEARALSPAEASRLLKVVENTVWHSVLVFALTTGTRRGEIAALRWADIDLEKRTVTIRRSLGQTSHSVYEKAPKSNRVRTIDVSDWCLVALKQRRKVVIAERLAAGPAYLDNGYVFCTELGRPIKPASYSEAFTRHARKANLSTSRLHATRHIFATWAIGAGADVRTVGAVLGHSAPSTTLNVYGHLIAGLQKQAVSAIDAALDHAGEETESA